MSQCFGPQELLIQLLTQGGPYPGTGWPKRASDRVEVEPYQPGLLWIDAHQAWQDCLLPLEALAPQGVTFPEPPEEWAGWVKQAGALVQIPCAVGYFPGLLRDLTLLLLPSRHTPPAARRECPALRHLAEQYLQDDYWAGALTIAGLLRWQGDPMAGAIVSEAQERTPAVWQPVILNEKAACLWAEGAVNEASYLWQTHPLCDHPVICFNRLLCQVFGREAEHTVSQETVRQACHAPGSWGLLAQLYKLLLTPEVLAAAMPAATQ